MLYFMTIGVAIFFMWLAYILITKCHSEVRSTLCGVISVVAFAVAIIMTLIIIFENGLAQGTKLKYEAQHESLIYQLEEIKYDNIIDNNRKELMEDILSYNKSVSIGQLYQHDFWFGIFYADIYYDLPLIEYK